MKYIVLYDPDGTIVGRLIMSNEAHSVHYDNGLSVTQDVYETQPETWAEIDTNTKQLKIKAGKTKPV